MLLTRIPVSGRGMLLVLAGCRRGPVGGRKRESHMRVLREVSAGCLDRKSRGGVLLQMVAVRLCHVHRGERIVLVD